jgi:hypothetical protein
MKEVLVLVENHWKSKVGTLGMVVGCKKETQLLEDWKKRIVLVVTVRTFVSGRGHSVVWSVIILQIVLSSLWPISRRTLGYPTLCIL